MPKREVIGDMVRVSLTAEELAVRDEWMRKLCVTMIEYLVWEQRTAGVTAQTLAGLVENMLRTLANLAVMFLTGLSEADLRGVVERAIAEAQAADQEGGK